MQQKQLFGLALATVGIIVVWFIVTGQLQRGADGSITLFKGALKNADDLAAKEQKQADAAAEKSADAAVVQPAYGSPGVYGPPTVPQGGGFGPVAATTSATQNLTSSGPYVALGIPGGGIPVGGSHLGLDPVGAA